MVALSMLALLTGSLVGGSLWTRLASLLLCRRFKLAIRHSSGGWSRFCADSGASKHKTILIVSVIMLRSNRKPYSVLECFQKSDNRRLLPKGNAAIVSPHKLSKFIPATHTIASDCRRGQLNPARSPQPGCE